MFDRADVADAGAGAVPPAGIMKVGATGVVRLPAWPPNERDRRRRLRAIVISTALLTTSLGLTARRHIHRHIEGDRLLDQGIVLVEDHPMRALAYLLAARSTGAGGPGLGQLFATVARSAPLVTIRPPDHDGFDHAAFTPDGRHIITADYHWRAQLWSTDTGARVGPPRSSSATAAQPPEIPDAVWSIKSGQGWSPDPEKSAGECGFAPGPNRAVEVQPGAFAIVRGWDPGRGVWDPRRGTTPIKVNGVAFTGCAVARGPAGMRYLGVDAARRTVIVWSADSEGPAAPVLRMVDDIVVAALSDDATRVVTGTDREMTAWDVATGRPLGPPIEVIASAAIFSPDGTRLAVTGAGGSVQVFDVATSKEVIPLRDNKIAVEVVAFSPDGRRLVAGGGTSARVWDIASGAALTAPLDHEGRVVAVAFNSKGDRVLTLDAAVHTWRIPIDEPRVPSPTRVSPEGFACSGSPLAGSDIGSLEEWTQFARCTPFTVRDGMLVANPDPAPHCYPQDCHEQPFLDFR
jgi:WD40 repeat protein